MGMSGLVTMLVVLLAVAPRALAGEPGSGNASETQVEAASLHGAGTSLVSGPTSTEDQLEQDARARQTVVGVPRLDRTLRPYFDWKDEVEARVGLRFGGDYSALYQVASSSPNAQQAAAGMYRIFGSWELIDRQGRFAGSLVFKGENRHDYGTEVTPLALGFEFGSALPTGVPFSDAGWLLSNLFWKQRFGDRVTLLFGQVDPTDYLDLYGLVSPWLHFTNLAFLTSPTIPAPSQGLGAALGVWVTDHVYAIAGFSDPTADPTRPFDDVFGDGEFFTHGEIGWTSRRDRLLLDNLHVMGWHVDAVPENGVPEGWGLAISASWFFGDRWMPFVRGGYSHDGGAPLERTVAGGLGVLIRKADLLGVGLSWGRPQARGARDQYTTELFYRIQLLPSFALTPDVQLIVDPSFDVGDNVVAVFGIRARLAF
jgi:porin